MCFLQAEVPTLSSCHDQHHLEKGLDCLKYFYPWNIPFEDVDEGSSVYYTAAWEKIASSQESTREPKRMQSSRFFDNILANTRDNAIGTQCCYRVADESHCRRRLGGWLLCCTSKISSISMQSNVSMSKRAAFHTAVVFTSNHFRRPSLYSQDVFRSAHASSYLLRRKCPRSEGECCEKYTWWYRTDQNQHNPDDKAKAMFIVGHSTAPL